MSSHALACLTAMAVAALTGVAALAPGIVIRHDREDALYRESE